MVKRKRKVNIRKIIFFTAIILLILFFFIIISFRASPQIISASVYPTKVRPGEVMLITVAVQGNINSVTAENTHDKGSDKISLQLKNIENGTRIYEGSWIVHDTKGETEYMTYITVTGSFGKTASAEVEWLDPTVTHKASQITAGTFGAGDYVFPGSLNVTDNLTIGESSTINKTMILKKTSAPSNNTGYGKLYYKTNDIDSYVKLMLFLNGSDGATSTTDSSPSAHSPISFQGNAQLDTAQKKFGTASLLLDGSGDYINLSDHADWYFGSGDFTIDLWVRFNTFPDPSGNIQLINQFDGGIDQDIAFQFRARNASSGQKYLDFYASSTKTTWDLSLPCATTLSTGTWYHIAVVRNGNRFDIYKDGVSIGSTTSAGYTIADSSQPLRIGSWGTDEYLNGWMDEIRVSKGIACWASNFTVPTSAYSGAGLIFVDEDGTENRLY